MTPFMTLGWYNLGIFKILTQILHWRLAIFIKCFANSNAKYKSISKQKTNNSIGIQNG